MPGIQIEIMEGRGSLVAKKNGVVTKTVNPGDGVVTVNYNVGDTFEFDAYPDTTLGYSFNKFCGDVGCTITTTQNPFSGTVTASGYLGVYFKGTPAAIQVSISGGQGSVDVYRNTRLIDTITTTSKTIDFFINDTFSFVANPGSGYQFDKFCADSACTTTTTTNPFTGTINKASGSLLTFFKTVAGTATVTVSRAQGSGSVTVLKNGQSIGTFLETDTSKVFNFTIGDSFSFTATPATGFKFDKFCADSACTVTTTTNPFTGTITQASGNLYTYFSSVSNEVGNISFASDPVGASIVLDDMIQSAKTPAIINNVPVGTHNFVLKLNGYVDYSGTITVQANTTVQVLASLTKAIFGLPYWEVYGGVIVGIGLIYYIATRHPEKVKRVVVTTRKGIKGEAARARTAYRTLRA